MLSQTQKTLLTILLSISATARADAFMSLDQWQKLAAENQARYEREVLPHLDPTPYRLVLPKRTPAQNYAIAKTYSKMQTMTDYQKFKELENSYYGERNVNNLPIYKNEQPLYSQDYNKETGVSVEVYGLRGDPVINRIICNEPAKNAAAANIRKSLRC